MRNEEKSLKKNVHLQRVPERVVRTEWTQRMADPKAVGHDLSNHVAVPRNRFIIGMYYPVPGVASKIY